MAQYHAITVCHAPFRDGLCDGKYAALETRCFYLRSCLAVSTELPRLSCLVSAGDAAGDRHSSDDSDEGGDSFDGDADEEGECEKEGGEEGEAQGEEQEGEEGNGGAADDGAGVRPRSSRLPARQARAVAPGGNCASDSDSNDAPSTSRSPCTLPACSPQEGRRDGFESGVVSSCGFCPHDGTCHCCQRQAERESRLVWYRPTEGEASAKRAKLTSQSVHGSTALAAHNVLRPQLAELTSALFDARYCATSQLAKARQELTRRACETTAMETRLRNEHRETWLRKCRMSEVASANYVVERRALLRETVTAQQEATAATATAEAERAARLQAADAARTRLREQRERATRRLQKAEKRATARQHAAVRLLLRPLPLYSMYSRQRVELLHGDELAMLTAHFERSVARHRGPAHTDPHRRAPMLRVRQIERLHSPRLQQKYLAEVQDIAGLCNQSVAPLTNVDAVPVQSFEGLELNERLMCVPRAAVV